MEVVTYQPQYLDELTRLYNELTGPVPHCSAITATELAAAFAGDCGYEAYGERLEQEAVFVALEREVMGFVHVGQGKTRQRDGGQPLGSLRFLAYPRGRRDAGQALLERAETWLRAAGLDSVLVYRQAYRYPFYHFAHAFLSNHLEHIQALLQMNGYQVCGGEIFLDWPHMNPGPAIEGSGLAIELGLKKTPGLGSLPDIKVVAYHHGQEIGTCISLSAASFSRREIDEDWIFTNWLGITEAYQGRGLGRYLLDCALIEARESGYRHAAISTAIDNPRALLFYANCGYQAVDWTRQFSRRLS